MKKVVGKLVGILFKPIVRVFGELLSNIDQVQIFSTPEKDTIVIAFRGHPEENPNLPLAVENTITSLSEFLNQVTNNPIKAYTDEAGRRVIPIMITEKLRNEIKEWMGIE